MDGGCIHAGTERSPWPKARQQVEWISGIHSPCDKVKLKHMQQRREAYEDSPDPVRQIMNTHIKTPDSAGVSGQGVKDDVAAGLYPLYMVAGHACP